MRVGIVYFCQNHQGRLATLAKAYSEGIAKQGHEVTLINGLKDHVNLFIYEYLVFGAETSSFFSSKISLSVQHSLKNLGQMAGKPSYAFLAKNGLWSSKSLLLWMKWLESCGLVLMLSDVVVKPSEARLIGEKIKIYKGHL